MNIVLCKPDKFFLCVNIQRRINYRIYINFSYAGVFVTKGKRFFVKLLSFFYIVLLIITVSQLRIDSISITIKIKCCSKPCRKQRIENNSTPHRLLPLFQPVEQSDVNLPHRLLPLCLC